MRIDRMVRAALFALCLFCASVMAQDFAHPWNPRTGDTWTDRQLADVNTYAARYRDAYIDELVRYFDAPRMLVTELLVERRWAPGDVYYACAIARVAGRPCRAVADVWAQGYAEGWEPIVRQMGIASGSDEATRLKLGFVDSYAHWARPIELDAQLARETRKRARAAARAEAKAKAEADAKAKADARAKKKATAARGKGG
jgi:hypothetical protein